MENFVLDNHHISVEPEKTLFSTDHEVVPPLDCEGIDQSVG